MFESKTPFMVHLTHALGVAHGAPFPISTLHTCDQPFWLQGSDSPSRKMLPFFLR
jgi:hypothetical protein